MFAWIPLTLCAAVMQIARTGLQKKLSGDVDIFLATWARYAFSCPLALAVLAVVAAGGRLPPANAEFFLYCLGGSIAQIVATLMLLATFNRRNFAIGTTYAHTEGVQFALIGLALGLLPSALGAAGIALGAVSIVLLARSYQGGGAHNALPTTLLGLGSGFFFALTILHIRLGYQVLSGTAAADLTADINAPISSAYTLSVMVLMQTAIMALGLRRPKIAVRRLWANRRIAAAIGITSFIGSFLWFTCFYIANPAYVKILSQVQLPFAYLVSRRAFAEHPNRQEVGAMICAAAAAILVVLA